MKCPHFLAVLLAVSLAAPLSAQTVDFEDLTLGTVYNVGDSFVDSGVTITGQTFFWSSGTPTDNGFTEVENGGLAGGSGLELQVNNINLDFNFGGAIPGLTIDFGEYGGNLNIDINGDFRNFENFAEIDGLTVGGALVTATGDGATGAGLGDLTFDGAIDSFAIGGQELWIDNAAAVPEPSTLALLGLTVMAVRRHRRA
ncbi:MAG: PEP-CTERM sorting domain-containing protein [Planctomycetota bacterium]|jgi:hypothetical protein